MKNLFSSTSFVKVVLFLFITGLLAFGQGENRINEMGLKTSTSHKNIGKKRKDVALFFAVKDYADTNISDLKNPIRDAETIACELEKHYGFEVHLHHNPTRDKILQSIAEMQKIPNGRIDQLLVFFSGHGTYWAFNDLGYFAPGDAISGDDRFHLDLNTIARSIFKIPCDHILLTIDACYSGNIHELDKDIPPIDYPIDILDSIKKSRPIYQQLKNKSRLIITSGEKNVKTPDGKEHSPFSNAFINALKVTRQKSNEVLIYEQLVYYLTKGASPKPFESRWEDKENSDEGGGFVFEVINANTNPNYCIKPDTPDKLDPPPTIDYQIYQDPNNGYHWTKENLDLYISGQSFHDTQDRDYIGMYGRLYTWEGAQKACQQLGKGWQLPSAQDWETLAGECLGCKNEINGITGYKRLMKTGKVQFNAKEAGYKAPNEQFKSNSTSSGNYWTSTSRDNENAVFFKFDSTKGALSKSYQSKKMAFSCRCIKK